MTSPRVRIYYEDARANGLRYPLHSFICNCVRDRLGHDRPAIEKRVVAHTANGVDKALVAFDKHQSAEFSILLVDRDRLHSHTKPQLTASTCRTRLFEAIHGLAEPRKSRSEIVFMEDNLESFLAHFDSTMGGAEFQNDLTLARQKGRGHHAGRDRALQEIALKADLRRHGVQFPAMARVVDAVIRFLK